MWNHGDNEAQENTQKSPLGTEATQSGVFKSMKGARMAGNLDRSHSGSHSAFNSSTQIFATPLFPFACDEQEKPNKFLYQGQVPKSLQAFISAGLDQLMMTMFPIYFQVCLFWQQ